MGFKATKPEDKKIDITHQCDVTNHPGGRTFATVFDSNTLNQPKYQSLKGNKNFEMSFDPIIVVNSPIDKYFLIKIRIRTKDEYLEYTI